MSSRMSSSWRMMTSVASAGTAALAMLVVVKALFEMQDPTQRRKRRACCQCCSSSSSSSSGYVTSGSDPSSNPYETETSVHEYLLMHFGGESELLNFPRLQGAQMKDSISFPLNCADECARWLASVPRFQEMGRDRLRALDIGCAVGRSSFELTRFAGSVVGLDYSHAFIQAANTLKQAGELPYSMRTEGDLKQHAVARVDPQIDRSRVRFLQGDACALSLDALGGERFHVILAANLLCRLPFPRRFLAALPGLVEADGFVVLPSPYTWLEQYTPKAEWVGGFVETGTGREVRSADRLQELMEAGGHFRLVASADMPFFIRETARKNQWSVSHLTVWQRTHA